MSEHPYGVENMGTFASYEETSKLPKIELNLSSIILVENKEYILHDLENATGFLVDQSLGKICTLVEVEMDTHKWSIHGKYHNSP